MPMKMGWRWYGEGNDPVTLSDWRKSPLHKKENEGIRW